MGRLAGAAAIVAIATLILAPSGGTRPAEDVLIDPGRAIGKVRLGMTLAQVKRILGKPQAVARQVAYAGNARYVEYQWDVEGKLSPDVWTVGLRNATLDPILKVVRIATSVPSERTRQGIGVGSTLRRLLTVYSDATCVSRSGDFPYRGTWVVTAAAAAGGMTAFLLDSSDYYNNPATFDVIEVLVQRTWFSQGLGHDECPPGWQQRYS